jgi:hypothetical protein
MGNNLQGQFVRAALGDRRAANSLARGSAGARGRRAGRRAGGRSG